MHKILHEEDKGARYRCTVNSDRSLSAYFNVTNPGNKKTTTVQFRIDSMCTCAVISPEVADLLELKFIKADETNFFFGRINLADGNWVHAPKHPLEFSLAGRPLPFVPVIDAFIPSTRGSYNLIGMDFLAPLCVRIDFGTDTMTIPKQTNPQKRHYIEGISANALFTSACIEKYYGMDGLKTATTFRDTEIATRAAERNERVMAVTAEVVGTLEASYQKDICRKILSKMFTTTELVSFMERGKQIAAEFCQEEISEIAPSWLDYGPPDPTISAPDDDDDGPPPLA